MGDQVGRLHCRILIRIEPPQPTDQGARALQGIRLIRQPVGSIESFKQGAGLREIAQFAKCIRRSQIIPKPIVPFLFRPRESTYRFDIQALVSDLALGAVVARPSCGEQGCGNLVRRRAHFFEQPVNTVIGRLSSA